MDFGDLSQELHKGIVRKFDRRRVYSPGPNHIWSCDIIDLNNDKKQNDGYGYLLICVDVFTKFVRAVPLYNKDAMSLLSAFQSFKILPAFVWADKGKEFYNKVLKGYFDSKEIRLYSTYSESKSVIAERFIRTFRNWLQLYLTMKNSLRWIDIWPEIIRQYNDRAHSTTKVKPKDAHLAKNFEKVYMNLYKDYENVSTRLPKNALKVGDLVRISKDKGIFEKGFDHNWSEELFYIGSVKMTNPITYSLLDYNNEPLEGTFYRQELQKTKIDDIDTHFRVEKILKTDKKNKRVLVKWLGWPSKFNSWEPMSSVQAV
jgi:hypothetical protein